MQLTYEERAALRYAISEAAQRRLSAGVRAEFGTCIECGTSVYARQADNFCSRACKRRYQRRGSQYELVNSTST